MGTIKAFYQKFLNQKLSLPYPITLRIKAIEKYDDPFRHVWLIRDIAEIIIKYHTSVILATYFDSAGDTVTDIERHELIKILEVPELGKWLKLSKDYFDKINHHCFIKELDYNKFKKYLKLASKLKDFRNDLAHGAVPPDDECARDIETFLPLVEQILDLNYLYEYNLILTDKQCNPQKAMGGSLEVYNIKMNLKPLSVYLQNNSGLIINLFPFMAYRPYEDEERLFFYNDFKGFRNVTLLNYESAVLYRNDFEYKALVKTFFKFNNDRIAYVDHQNKYLDYDTTNIINALSQNFVGRTSDFNELNKFIDTDKSGFYFIIGLPGVGKSSFISEFCNHHYNNRKIFPLFIGKNNLRETTEILFLLAKSLDYRINEPFDKKTYSIKIKQSIIHWSEQNKPIVILLDGFDEAGNQEELIRYLPKTLPVKNIKFIICSRPGKNIDSYYESIEKVQRNRRELERLNRENIRAILYSYVNKYDIQEKHVDTIIEKSDSNPLYLLFLCQDIEQKRVSLDTLDKLPENFEGFYKRRLSNKNSNIYKKILYSISVCKGFVTCEIIASLSGIDSFDTDNYLDEIRDLLLVSRTENDIKTYQLFHSSLFEFLKNLHPDKYLEYKTAALRFCLNYKDYQKFSFNYEFAIHNLFYYLIDPEIGDISEAQNLATNLDYLQALKEIRGGYPVAYDLFSFGLSNIIAEDQASILNLAEHLDFFEQDSELNVDDLIESIRKGKGETVSKLLKYNSEGKLNYSRLLLLTCIKYPEEAEKLFNNNKSTMVHLAKLSLIERKYFFEIFSRVGIAPEITFKLSSKYPEQQLILNVSNKGDLLSELYHTVLETNTIKQIDLIRNIFLNTSYKECIQLYNSLPITKLFIAGYHPWDHPDSDRYNTDQIDRRLIPIINANIIFASIEYLSTVFELKNIGLKEKYYCSTNAYLGPKICLNTIYEKNDPQFDDSYLRNLFYLLRDEDYKYISLLIDEVELNYIIKNIQGVNTYKQFVILRLLLDKAKSLFNISNIKFNQEKWFEFFNGRESDHNFMIYLSETYLPQVNSVVKIELPKIELIKDFLNNFIKETTLFVKRDRDGDEYRFVNETSSINDQQIREELEQWFYFAYLHLLDNFSSETLELVEAFLNAELTYKSDSEYRPDDNGLQKLSLFLGIKSIKDIGGNSSDYDIEIFDSSILPYLFFSKSIWENEYFKDRIKFLYLVDENKRLDSIKTIVISYNLEYDFWVEDSFGPYMDFVLASLSKILGYNKVLFVNNSKDRSSDRAYQMLVSGVINSINKIINTNGQVGLAPNDNLLHLGKNYSVFNELDIDLWDRKILLKLFNRLDFPHVNFLCPLLVALRLDKNEGILKYRSTLQNMISYKEKSDKIDLSYVDNSSYLTNLGLRISQITKRSIYLTQNDFDKILILFSEPSYLDLISYKKQMPTVRIALKNIDKTIGEKAIDLFIEQREQEQKDYNAWFEEWKYDDDGNIRPRKPNFYDYDDYVNYSESEYEADLKDDEWNAKKKYIQDDYEGWFRSMGVILKHFYKFISPEIIDLLHSKITSAFGKQLASTCGIKTYVEFLEEDSIINKNLLKNDKDIPNDYEKKLNFYFNMDDKTAFKKGLVCLEEIADEIIEFKPLYFEGNELYAILKNNFFCKPIRNGVLNELKTKNEQKEFVREEFYVEDEVTPQRLGEALYDPVSNIISGAIKNFSNDSNIKLKNGFSFTGSHSRYKLNNQDCKNLPPEFYMTLEIELNQYYIDFSKSFWKMKFDRYYNEKKINSANNALTDFFLGNTYNLNELITDHFEYPEISTSKSRIEIKTVIDRIEQSIEKFCNENYITKYYEWL